MENTTEENVVDDTTEEVVMFEPTEYIACVTYCLVSKSGDSISGTMDTYFDAVTFDDGIDKLLRFASKEQPQGQTLCILSWRIGEVYYTSGGQPHV